MHRPLAALVFSVVGLTVLSCGEQGDPDTGIGVRDSSGIEIVESSAPALGPDAWTIDPLPTLEIGSIDGAEPYIFTRVWDAAQLPDGRLVVVDEMTLQLRVYGPDGAHLVTFGGEGEGPAEFGGPPFVASTADGRIVAWDGGRQRLTRFSVDGELLDDVSLSEPLSAHGVFPFRNGRVWEIDSEGRLLSTGPGRPERTEGLRHSYRRVVLVGDDGVTTHDFGQVPSGQSFVVQVERMSIGVGNPFAPSSRAALTERSRVVVADAEEWALSVYASDGALERIVRAAVPRLPVTPELEEIGRDGARSMAERSPLSVRQAEEAYSQIPLPDSVPAIGSLMSDGDRLWVGRRIGRWFEVAEHDVFDADGRWLTTVSMPPEVQAILEIGDDYLLAHVQDELEVSYVRSYRIQN